MPTPECVLVAHLYVCACCCARGTRLCNGCSAEIWNKGTRPRDRPCRTRAFFPLSSFYCRSFLLPPSSRLLRSIALGVSVRLVSIVLSNLGCYRGNTGTGRRRDHRRPAERRENGERPSAPLALPASSRRPSSPAISSSPSAFSAADQMFEKINKTLPAGSSSSSPSSLSPCDSFSVFLSTRAIATRHPVCVTRREKPLQ